MLDRRTLLAGGAALGLAGGAWASLAIDRKRAAIDAIQPTPGFGGLFAYAAGGRIRHLRCLGLADVEAGVPVTPDTSFKFGSASKWLVSVAVLRLVEQGRLSLEAPITSYLPEFRRDTGGRVTLAHLLSNTSGIPDLLSQRIGAEPELRTSTASAKAIVARFGGGDLAFAPGRGWDYAALNWAIVAAIVEQVTRRTIPALVSDQIFRPLGMRGAGFVQSDQPALPGFAAAYTSGSPPTRKMASVPPFLAASGNVAGTARDAVRAAHGIFHGRLLTAPMRAELTRVRWPEQEYALGGRVHPIDGRRWAWEQGKVQGYRTHIAHRLDRSETIVIFNNTDLDQSVLTGWVEAIARA